MIRICMGPDVEAAGSFPARSLKVISRRNVAPFSDEPANLVMVEHTKKRESDLLDSLCLVGKEAAHTST